jgi:hypothetical protein
MATGTYITTISKDSTDYPIYDERVQTLATAANANKVIGISAADTLTVIDVDAKISAAIGDAISAAY